MNKTCPKCEETKDESCFWRRKTGPLQSHCKSCRAATAKESGKEYRSDSANIVHIKEYRKAKTLSIKTRADTLIRGARRRCSISGRDINITSEYVIPILERGICQVTGIKFDLAGEHTLGRSRSPWAPSIDRIDNTKGYVIGNVQIVVWLYNQSKGESTREEFSTLVRALAKPLFAAAISEGKIAICAAS